MLRRALLIVTLALPLLAVSAHALPAAPTTSLGSAVGAVEGAPTPPGGSRGTASVWAVQHFDLGRGYYDTTTFFLDGTLRFGNVTHRGSFWIHYENGNSQHAALGEGDTVIGTCKSVDNALYWSGDPAVAVVRCQGSFPGQGSNRLTTLVFALPEVGSCGPKCNGYAYSGRYVG